MEMNLFVSIMVGFTGWCVFCIVLILISEILKRRKP